MKTKKQLFAVVTVGAFIFGVMSSLLSAAEDKAAKTKGSLAADDLFAGPKVHRLKIELPASAQETLNKNPKQYVKASVREGDRSFADVGVRLKGSATFETLDKKPGLSLKFNEFVKDQEFHGRSRILLNNARQDPTYLCEAIGGEIFRAAGVPAAKVTYARVEINGRDLGLYVVAEAANKDFLSQYFKKAKGNLYEGSNNDVTDKLEKDGGDSSNEQADLRALANAAKEPDLAQRWKKLTTLLDIDRFIAFAAVEVLIGHHDGYTMDKNNYRIYHDPASDQMVFLPHGLDQLFAKTDEPLIPEWKGTIAKAVLHTPAGQKQYLEKMSGLLSSAFKPDALQSRINEWAATIRPALAESNSGATRTFDEAVIKLREQVAKRAVFIEQQLKTQAVK
jgi:spore coat protein CotH